MSVILPPNRIVLSGRTRVRELVFPIPVGDFQILQTASMNPSAGSTFFVTWSSDGLTLLHGSDSSNTLYARTHTVPYDISSGVGTAISGNITGNWSGGIPDATKNCSISDVTNDPSIDGNAGVDVAICKSFTNSRTGKSH